MRFVILFLSLHAVVGNMWCQYEMPVGDDTLNVLSWNVYMRPRKIFWNNQIERSKLIVEKLLEEDLDIIVLQEVFDKKSKKIISQGLESKYPFSAGPGQQGLFRLSSGVMIFSKLRILQTLVKPYKKCKKADCFAKKSAVLATFTNGVNNFHVVATHMQAGGGSTFGDIIRRSQLKTIAKLSNKLPSNELQIFAGDFNTHRHKETYQEMLEILDAKDNDPCRELKCSSDPKNDFKKDKSKKGTLIDYILIKDNNAGEIVETEIMRYQKAQKTGMNDLSDHYAIKTKIMVKNK